MHAHVPCPARGSCLSGGELCSVGMVPRAALHLRVRGDRDVVLLFKLIKVASPTPRSLLAPSG